MKPKTSGMQQRPVQDQAAGRGLRLAACLPAGAHDQEGQVSAAPAGIW